MSGEPAPEDTSLEEEQHTQEEPRERKEEEQPKRVLPMAPRLLLLRVSNTWAHLVTPRPTPSSLLLLFRCFFFILSKTDHVFPSLSSCTLLTRLLRGRTEETEADRRVVEGGMGLSLRSGLESREL